MDIQFSQEKIRNRYDSLARYYHWIDILTAVPPQLRKEAIKSLRLKRGDSVLDVGCGTGVNFKYLVNTVGKSGKTYGVDISNGMLKKARELCSNHKWKNVEIIEADATSLQIDGPLDAVLFSFSYSVIPSRNVVLRNAWNLLKPGGKLVIVDGRAPFSQLSKITLPIIQWLSERTVLSDGSACPWKDLEELSGKIHLKEIDGYSTGIINYYYCYAVKP